MAHDDTKTRLLEAAGEEFAEKGFEGATIRAIIEKAKANIAAVNYHFGDKERLYVQAVIEAHRCGMDTAEEPDSRSATPTRGIKSSCSARCSGRPRRRTRWSAR